MTRGNCGYRYGVPWPPKCDQSKWQPPKPEEVSQQLEKLLQAGNSGEALPVNTAPAYRGSEAVLGEALSRLDAELQKRVVICTKFGEYYNEQTGENEVHIPAVYHGSELHQRPPRIPCSSSNSVPSSACSNCSSTYYAVLASPTAAQIRLIGIVTIAT